MSKRPHDELDEELRCRGNSSSPVSSSPNSMKRCVGLNQAHHLAHQQQTSNSQAQEPLVNKLGSHRSSPFEVRKQEAGRVDNDDECNSPQDPAGSPKMVVGEPTTSGHSKHLVRTLSDLPQFVTIEGFRVASYSIDGEPYLCLPNLLQFIQQSYALEKVIKVFENTVTRFKSATPKQVEGFIKAIVLPEGAKTCPLIRKIDADRVFEVLVDNHSGDEVDQITNEKLNDFIESETGKQLTPGSCSVDNKTAMPENRSQIQDVSIMRQSEANQISAAGCSTQLAQGHTSAERDLRETNCEVDLSRSRQLYGCQPAQTTSGCGIGGISSRVFDTNHDSAILNLARASTSMLRIRVYHRCFGKCDGLYYPSKMRDSDSKCIECVSCHVLLNPRKFIRHTHGPREENVCHWGFVSSNWRYYISLKKNQDTNDLDDEELLVQLNSLREAPDRYMNGGEKLGFEAQVKNDHMNQARSKHEKVRHRLVTSSPTASSSLSSPSVVTPILNPANIPTAYPPSLNQKPSAIQSNNPIGIVRPTVSDSVISDGIPMSSLVHSLARKLSAEPQQDPASLPYLRASTAMSRVRSQNPQEQHTLNASVCPYSPHYPLNGLLANPLLFSHHFDQSVSTSSHVNPYDFIRSTSRPATSNISSGRLPHIEERLIKQDIFVSSSMASYLSSRNLSGDLVRDIIEQTLDAIHKSRMMY